MMVEDGLLRLPIATGYPVEKKTPAAPQSVLAFPIQTNHETH